MALEYLGKYDQWSLYRNDDGFVEGIKSYGKKTVLADKTYYANSSRVISNQTTPDGFLKYIKGLSPSKRVKEIELKPSKLPSLFTDEQTD